MGASLLNSPILISFVTVGELLKWAQVRSWGPDRRAELARWLDPFPVIQSNWAVSAAWRS